MRTQGWRSLTRYLLTGLFLLGMGVFLFRLVTEGDMWAMQPYNRHLKTETTEVQAGGEAIWSGTITDRSGVTLVQTQDGERQYNDDLSIRKATLHTVGDLNGSISTGIQLQYRAQLLGYNPITGVNQIQNSSSGSTIELTLDASLCQTALQGLGNYKGAVILMNYKTGDILCKVSTPTFDPENLPADIETNNQYKGAYYDRTLSVTYAPGSTFKVFTAASAIQHFPDWDTRTYTCEGKEIINGNPITCMGTHGTLDIRQGLAVSCNILYADLAVDLGAVALTDTCKQMGFDRNWDLDGITVKASRINLDGATEDEIGWAGIGQYTTEVTPYHMMLAANAIANGGRAVTPHIISSITDGNGIVSTPETSYLTLLDSSTAAVLDELMRNDVIVDYGDSNFPAGMEVCGKTGTAEVGDDKKDTAWFFGYCRNPDTPYAFAVVVEEGGYGRTAAMPIVISLLQQLA